MTKRQILTAAIVTVGGFGLVSLPASAEDNAASSAAQPSAGQSSSSSSAGQSSAGQSSSSAQPSGSDASGSGAQTAGSSSGATANASQSDAKKVLSQTANAIVSKDGLKNLSQQVCSKDAQRVGDLSQQQAQVDQAADQLRQAYKDKYQKDLDLSQNADQVFTAEFIQIGGASDQARQASGQVPADQGTSPSASSTGGASGSASGTSGSSGAGASGSVGAGGASGTANIGGASVSGNVGSSGAAASATGDAAQTAGSSMGGTTVTIPASHGMPEARIRLVQEGGQWKIALPQGADAKQFADNVSKQLQQCAQMKDQWPADANQAQQAIVHSVLIAFSDQSSGGASGSSSSSSGAGTSGASGTSGTSGASGTSGSTGTGSSGSSSSGTSGAGGTSSTPR